MEKIKYYMHLVQDSAGDLLAVNPYLWVFLFMTLESMFIPFPSEIVMIPAGWYAASTSTPYVTLFIFILLGTAGSIFGALINYVIAVYGGEKISKKLLGEKNHNMGVKFFKENGDVTTFIARLIPVVRQVISFPAGLFRMNLKKFIFYTGSGAFIWVTFLAFVGFYFGNNPELVSQYKYQLIAGTGLLLVLVVFGKIYLLKKLRD